VVASALLPLLGRRKDMRERERERERERKRERERYVPAEEAKERAVASNGEEKRDSTSVISH